MSIPLKRRGFIAGILAVPFLAKFSSIKLDEPLEQPPRGLAQHVWPQSCRFTQQRLEASKHLLPKGIEIFEIEGQSVFAMYGPSGGLLSASAFYLIDKENNLSCGVKVTQFDTPQDVDRKLRQAIMHMKPCNLDGGPLPECIS